MKNTLPQPLGHHISVSKLRLAAGIASAMITMTPYGYSEVITKTSGSSYYDSSYPNAITGISAEGSSTIITGNGITVSGPVESADSALINLFDSSVTGTSATISASNGGSLNLVDVTVDRGFSTESPYGIYLSSSATLTANRTNVTITGSASSADQRGGFEFSDKSSGTIEYSHVTTSGDHIHGVYNTAGTTSFINDSTLSTNGTGAIGIYSYSQGSRSVVKATDVSISTSGDYGLGIYATATKGGAIATGFVEATRLHITTTGDHAFGSYAKWGGELNLTDSSITTTGVAAYGVRIDPQTAEGIYKTNAFLYDTTVKTSGELAHGYFVDDGGILNVVRGSVTTTDESAVGAHIGRSANLNLADSGIQSAGTAIQATFGEATHDIGNFNTWVFISGTSVINSESGTLLNVTRESGDDSFGRIAGLNFFLDSEGRAYGDIFDLGEKTSGFLNITVNSGAHLTANRIEGFDDMNIDGYLLGNGTIVVGGNQTLRGGGVIAHDVVVDGGTLGNYLILRGRVTLDADSQEHVGNVTETYSVESGKQAIINTVASDAYVNVSAGTATIETAESNATIVTGNWGAEITNLDGATIEAGNGTLHITNITGGNITYGTLSVNNNGESVETPTGALTLQYVTVQGNGTIAANTTFFGGQLNPGNSPGTLNFAGDLTLGDYTYTTFELGATASDFINVAGALHLAGTLVIVLDDNYAPLLNETIDLFTFGSISGNFYEVYVEREGYTARFNSDSGSITFEAVPEPGTYLFLLSGAAATWWMSRRPKKEAA